MKELDIWHLCFDKYKVLSVSDLSAIEKEKASSFKFIEDKNNYIKSHLFLRDVLSHYFPNQSKASWKYKINPYGKPSLASSFNLHFNLSHTSSHAYIICSKDAQCGIDIEEYTDMKLSSELLDMVLCKKEQKDINKKLFFKYWTLKEAYIKALGKGLSIELNKVDFSSWINEESFMKDKQKYWSYDKKEYSLSFCILSKNEKIKKNFYTQDDV